MRIILGNTNNEFNASGWNLLSYVKYYDGIMFAAQLIGVLVLLYYFIFRVFKNRNHFKSQLGFYIDRVIKYDKAKTFTNTMDFWAAEKKVRIKVLFNVLKFFPLLPLILLVIMYIQVFLHECLHIITYPGSLFSNKNILSINFFVASALHDGYLSRTNMLISLAFPTIVFLSITIILYILFLKPLKNKIIDWLFVLCILFFIVSGCIDIVCFFEVLFTVPTNAVFYGSFWKN